MIGRPDPAKYAADYRRPDRRYYSRTDPKIQMAVSEAWHGDSAEFKYMTSVEFDGQSPE